MGNTEVFRNLPEEKKDRIYHAAINEFAEEGYKAASMNSLVKEAGISKGSLFQYFMTKLDLFDSIVSHATAIAKSKLKKARKDTNELDIQNRLKSVIRAGFDFIDSHPKLAKIYFRMLHTGNSPFGSQRLIKLQKQSIEFLESILMDASDELDKDLDIRKTAFLINGIMQQLLHAYYTENIDSGLGLYHGEESELDAWIDSSVNMIFRGIKKQ